MTEKSKTILISDDSLAKACGADALADEFQKLGNAVKRVSSWGMQWLEPLVEINGRGFGPAEVEDIPYILDGTSDKDIGIIAEHPFIAKQQRLTFARAGKIRSASAANYAETGGWAGLNRAQAMNRSEIISEVIKSGLRGRGGAGFPTGIKWQTVADAPGDRKYIVCNADEGDSGTFADRMVMEGDPFALIEGMAIAGLATGAGKGFIYIRSEYPDAVSKMRAAIASCPWKFAPFDIEVRVGAGAYVCGEETSLLNSLEGKRGEVRAKPPLPALEGLFGHPTVVNNVLTLAAVPHILAEGGAAQYDSLGMERSKGTIPIQLAGNIKHGGLYETAFGVTLEELVHDIGGGTASGLPVKAVQVGGPLGSFIHPSKFDMPFDYEAYTAADSLIGHGGVVVFDESIDMSEMARFALQFCAEESCGKCTPCRIGAVRGMEIVERVRAGGRQPDHIETAPQIHNSLGKVRTREDELQLLEDLCETMQSGSLCALGGFAPYPVRSALQFWPEDFAA